MDSSSSHPAGERPETAITDTQSAQADSPTDVTAAPTKATFNRRLPLLLSAVVLVAGAVAVNFPYKHMHVAVEKTGKVSTHVDFVQASLPEPVIAGWPYRYLIRYPATTSSAEVVSLFSWRALLLNVLLAMVLVGMLLLYLGRRYRVGNKNLSIADLLVLTILFAIPLGWWQWAGTQHQAELKRAKQLQSNGVSFVLSGSLPQFLESRAPQAWKKRLQRIRAVRVENPGEETLQLILDQPQIACLRIGGGQWDLRMLDRLSGNPHIEDLRIAGRDIDAQTLRVIASQPRLHTLNLMQTNVTAEALQQLDSLKNLQRLSLVHTNLAAGDPNAGDPNAGDPNAGDLGKPAWSETIEELRLPRPRSGAGSLRIANWPQLQDVQVSEMDAPMNPSAMSLELSDLPKLTSLKLGIFQKFDLQLKNLPQLQQLEADEYRWSARIPRGGKVPGVVWCRKLDIDGVPKLKEFNFFAVDLRHLRLRGVPSLQQLGIAVFYRTFQNSVYEAGLSEEAATALIEGLGQSEGPSLVDLDAVPLKGVDLSPLANNKQLTHLKLATSETDISQWKQLEPMKWLQRLDLKNNPIEPEGFTWLLKNFPNLQYLTCSLGGDLEQLFATSDGLSLEIVGHQHLQTLDLGEGATQLVSRVKIVDVPKLKMSLDLPWVQTLELANAPGINGLRVEGAFPPEAKLQELRDLQYFAAGGPTLTDEVVTSLQSCKNLHTLTLAYPSVSAESLEVVKHFPSLRSLHLPGTPLNDEIVAQWPPMANLVHLDLSDTEITGRSLEKLLATQQLETLRLDRTKIAKSDLAALAQQPYLRSLSLAEIGIDAATLNSILEGSSIYELDLSGSELSPQTLDAILQSGEKLQYLSLLGCTLEPSKIAEIARRYPLLKMNLNPAALPTNLVTSLLGSERIKSQEDWEMEKAMMEYQTAMEAMTAYGQTSQAPIQFMSPGSTSPARVNVRDFAKMRQAYNQFGGNQPATNMMTINSVRVGPIVVNGPPANLILGPTATGAVQPNPTLSSSGMIVPVSAGFRPEATNVYQSIIYWLADQLQPAVDWLW